MADPVIRRRGPRPLSGMRKLDRMFTQVEQSGDCWEWTGPVTNSGYGATPFRGSKTTAHRAVWVLMRGEIEAGLEVDHLCRNRLCVNPDHLDIVTHDVNMRRLSDAYTTCQKGHSMDDAYVTPSTGRRQCRLCAKEREIKRGRS